MTFPQQLHDILNDPVKEKAVLDLIQVECQYERNLWRGVPEARAASYNLLCRFLGVTKEE